MLQNKRRLLSLNRSPLSVVSVREHHDFTLMLLAVGASFPKCPPLAQNHSEAVSLCGLFAFCANPPPTTPATYCWESLQCHVSQSALPSVCLTLCLCCHGEVHSLMVCKPGSSQIPVCLSCYSSYLLACLPYGSTVCLLANIWDVWSSHVASLCYSLISVCVSHYLVLV